MRRSSLVAMISTSAVIANQIALLPAQQPVDPAALLDGDQSNFDFSNLRVAANSLLNVKPVIDKNELVVPPSSTMIGGPSQQQQTTMPAATADSDAPYLKKNPIALADEKGKSQQNDVFEKQSREHRNPQDTVRPYHTHHHHSHSHHSSRHDFRHAPRQRSNHEVSNTVDAATARLAGSNSLDEQHTEQELLELNEAMDIASTTTNDDMIGQPNLLSWHDIHQEGGSSNTNYLARQGRNVVLKSDGIENHHVSTSNAAASSPSRMTVSFHWGRKRHGSSTTTEWHVELAHWMWIVPVILYSTFSPGSSLLL